MDRLKEVAREALDSFGSIADAAAKVLQQRGLSLADLAVVNEATAETIAADMRSRNEERVSDCMHLRREPAIARLVLIDEDEQQETLYISPVTTVGAQGVRMCSYMSQKGRLASLKVGEGMYIVLPNGKRWFDVIEKMTFKPALGEGWDARPAIHFRENDAPLTILSLREFLRASGVPDEEADLALQWLADDEANDDNVFEGIRRETLTAMQLRVAPILDAIQDRIFRLAIDSQIAMLGPPGTGKTTTLVRRLRQKLDLMFLDADEQERVSGPDEAGLAHSASWVMFTPTELLRQYVKEAFSKEGVPAPDDRLHTWDDYRREIARNDLSLLRKGSGKGLVMKQGSPRLLPATLTRQIDWFEDFDAFQQALFVDQMAIEAERLGQAGALGFATMGRRVQAAIARGRDRPLQLVGELAGWSEELRGLASEMNAQIRTALDAPLNRYGRDDEGFRDAFPRFVTELLAEANDDDADEEDDDDEGEEEQRLTGKRLIIETFRRAMRARAIAQALGRSVSAKSRSGKVLAFITQRGLDLPDIKDVGGQLLLQRAARRLARGPVVWLSGVSLRYRAFRRMRRGEGLWYSETGGGALEVDPAEVDTIILAILAHARAMETDALIRSRGGDLRPALLDAIVRLRRNQVLVDEATDFSPLQLAIMRNLASLRTDAVFISGDFNQRLTLWGSRSEDELKWAVPGIAIERVDVTYRQSRKLAEFALELAQLQGAQVNSSAPEHLENQGWEPVLGSGLVDHAATAVWLAARVREIETITDGVMPTIAILVDGEEHLDSLAELLSAELEDMNIRAVACPKGLVKGQAGDVRIFDVQHIKGLEFEAVFFVDIDRLDIDNDELFQRLVYVGATRAATFLGLTCTGESLPPALQPLTSHMRKDWQL